MSSKEIQYLTRSSKYSVLPSYMYYYVPTNASGLLVSRALFKPQNLNFQWSKVWGREALDAPSYPLGLRCQTCHFLNVYLNIHRCIQLGSELQRFRSVFFFASSY